MKILSRLVLLSVLCVWQGLATANFSVETKADLVVLDNGTGMKAVVAPEQGGELSGFSVLFNGNWYELLYRALDYSDKPGWRGKAPLLWPATGISIIEHNQEPGYELNGVHYTMPFHGFARSQPWQLIKKEQSAGHASVTLELSDNAESRRHYPFGFRLQVEYRLDDKKLSLIYRLNSDVANMQEMPFSIGNHITFKAPLIGGSKPGDVQFESDFPKRLVTGANKAFAGLIEPSPFPGLRNLSELPRRKSVSLGGSQADPRLIIHDPSGLFLQLVHRSRKTPDFPFTQFNLWADTVDGFFSPEPWVGTQNALNTGAGLTTLSPGESWQWVVDIIPGVKPRAKTNGQKDMK